MVTDNKGKYIMMNPRSKEVSLSIEQSNGFRRYR